MPLSINDDKIHVNWEIADTVLNDNYFFCSLLIECRVGFRHLLNRAIKFSTMQQINAHTDQTHVKHICLTQLAPD